MALVFTFMILVMLAGFSLGMFQLSNSISDLQLALDDKNQATLNAQVGVNYFTQQLITMDLSGKSASEMKTYLESEINVKKYCNTEGGWFELVPVDSANSVDVLQIEDGFMIKVLGSHPQTLTTVAFSSFVAEEAYAQSANVVSAKLESVIGPSYDSSGGNGGYFATTPEFNNTASIGVYPTGTGTVRTPSGNGISSHRLLAGVTEQTLSNGDEQRVRDYMKERLDQVNKLYNSKSWPSMPSSTQHNENTSLSAGTYNFNNKMEFKGNSSYTIGDSSTDTFLKADKLEVDNNATLAMGPGKYDFNDDVQIKNNTYVTIGDPSGTKFTYFKTDKLQVDNNATLVLGPGVYEIRDFQFKNNVKVILDTTNGPVYINGQSSGSGEFEFDNKAEVIVFKDQNQTLDTYSKKTDLNNSDQELGPNGQKIGMMFLTSGGGEDSDSKVEFKNNTKVGVFATGSQSDIWNSGTSVNLSSLNGNNSEYVFNTNPTAGVMQIFAGGGGGEDSQSELKMDNHATVNGAVFYNAGGGEDSEAKLEFKNNATLNGLLAVVGGGGEDSETEFKFDNSFKFMIDPNLSPFPKKKIPGSYHQVYRRVVTYEE